MISELSLTSTKTNLKCCMSFFEEIWYQLKKFIISWWIQMCILVSVHKQTVNNGELSNWKSFGKCLRKAISILILIEMCYKVFQTIENALLSNIVSDALPHLRIRMHISNANIIFDVIP